MRILVLGGAGYIGSHYCHVASEYGAKLTVIDDLSSGHAWAVKSHDFVLGSILDEELLVRKMEDVDSVVHFAAKSIVSESFENSSEYMRTNVLGTQTVLKAMTRAGVKRLVFSSSAAVYGVPEDGGATITEDFECCPINPYGESKLQAEKLISAWVASGNGQALCFRYFNAAGALPEAEIGEAHEPETHLIPNILKALLSPSTKEFVLFGDDHATPDGFCIRDYVHVVDIAQAHVMAAEFLSDGKEQFVTCNLGSGTGYSNYEVIEACEIIHGGKLSYKIGAKRPGDPPRLVASNEYARLLLGWQPTHSDLPNIVRSAYQWHFSHG